MSTESKKRKLTAEEFIEPVRKRQKQELQELKQNQEKRDADAFAEYERMLEAEAKEAEAKRLTKLRTDFLHKLANVSEEGFVVFPNQLEELGLSCPSDKDCSCDLHYCDFRAAQDGAVGAAAPEDLVVDEEAFVYFNWESKHPLSHRQSYVDPKDMVFDSESVRWLVPKLEHQTEVNTELAERWLDENGWKAELNRDYTYMADKGGDCRTPTALDRCRRTVVWFHRPNPEGEDEGDEGEGEGDEGDE
jgi:hypothetical protein